MKKLVFVCLCLLLVSPAYAGKVKFISAEATFDPNGLIRGDGDSTVPYIDGTEDENGIPIRVRIDPATGRFSLETYERNSPSFPWEGRPIVFEFISPPVGAPDSVALGAPAGPHPTAIQLFLAVKDMSGTVDYPGGLLGMDVDNPLPGNITANFRYTPDTDHQNELYTVRFHLNWSDSSQALVTCTVADADGECTEWTIETVSGSEVGTLLSGGSSRDEGDYHLPFLMTITMSSDSSGGSGGNGGGKGKNK